MDQQMCWQGSATGNRGLRRKYSEAAIQFCLTIKSLFTRANCQTRRTQNRDSLAR